MKITLLNGPPSCGKDYAGTFLCQFHENRFTDKFARKLKEACHAAYGLFVNGKPAPHDFFEHVKDKPNSSFFGRSPREVYIAFSESYMKPMHGPRVFGYLLCRDLEMITLQDEVIITDSGFTGEAMVLIERFGAGNVRLIRIHRQGCTFEGDSRSYIELGVKSFDVTNNGDDSFHGVLLDAYTQ